MIIPGHFRDIFSRLYNSADDSGEVLDVLKQVEEQIDEESLNDVNLVTPDIIRKAAQNLQDSKSDPELNFSSDCIKNGPPKLFNMLATAMRTFLIHGHVTHFLLLATLVPLVKDKLGNLNSSKNYRTIAISSLVLNYSIGSSFFFLVIASSSMTSSSSTSLVSLPTCAHGLLLKL